LCLFDWPVCLVISLLALRLTGLYVRASPVSVSSSSVYKPAC
jgi:hypothetical protein